MQRPGAPRRPREHVCAGCVYFCLCANLFVPVGGRPYKGASERLGLLALAEALLAITTHGRAVGEGQGSDIGVGIFGVYLRVHVPAPASCIRHVYVMYTSCIRHVYVMYTSCIRHVPQGPCTCPNVMLWEWVPRPATCTHPRALTHAHTHARTHTHTHTHTHVHTCTHSIQHLPPLGFPRRPREQTLNPKP